VLIVLKSGRLSLLEPSGPVEACNGIALPLPLPFKFTLIIVPVAKILSSVSKEKQTSTCVCMNTIFKIFDVTYCLSDLYFISCVSVMCAMSFSDETFQFSSNAV